MPIIAEIEPEATPKSTASIGARLEPELEHVEPVGREADAGTSRRRR